MGSTDRDELIALGLSTELFLASDGYHSTRILSNEAAADRLLASEWLRKKLADAYDEGVRRAGRYGHEDSWDNEINPHIENPWRTTEELIEEGWSVEYRD